MNVFDSVKHALESFGLLYKSLVEGEVCRYILICIIVGKVNCAIESLGIVGEDRCMRPLVNAEFKSKSGTLGSSGLAVLSFDYCFDLCMRSKRLP
jgi:hypothetical protein